MSDIYKIAAQTGIRFVTNRGELTVEQLFAMPLKSGSGFDLDTTARTINSELKEMSEESFVEDPAANPRKVELETSLAIVKDVIKTKQEENAAVRLKAAKVIERKKILDAIGAKKDAALTTASLDELEKKLAELD